MAAPSHLRRRVDSILREGRTFSSGLSRTGWFAIALIGVPVVWGAGAVKLDRRAPMLPLDFPKWTVPAPPPLLAQARTTPTAPTPARRVEFEVASVRSANPETGRCTVARFTMDAGSIDIRCASLQQLMEHAFRLPQTQVAGPDWLAYHGGPKFDIAAKLPQGASEDQVPEMLQALLAERFKLVSHREYKEQPVDALVITKSGLKLEEAPPEESPSTTAAGISTGRIDTVNGTAAHTSARTDGPGLAQTNSRIRTYRETGLGPGHFRWEISGATMEGLADLMAERLKRPVMDRTELKGRYQVTLEVKAPPLDLTGLDAAPDLAAASAVIYEQLTGLRDSFNAALQKVGLQLEMRKAPVEFIVVDRVEKTPTDN